MKRSRVPIMIWMKLKPKQPRVLVGLGTGVRRIHGPACGMMRMMAKPMMVARLGAGVAGEDPGTVIIMIRMGMKPMVVRPMMVARLGAGVVEEEPRTGIIVMRI